MYRKLTLISDFPDSYFKDSRNTFTINMSVSSQDKDRKNFSKRQVLRACRRMAG